MTKISMRVFSRTPGWFIERLAAGEALELTRYGRTIARVLPPGDEQPAKDPGPIETEPIAGSPLTRDALLRKMNQRGGPNG